jgi:hypothetical protein
MELKKRKSNFDILPIQNNVAIQSEVYFIPATEPSFTERLQKALQKNFDYIFRFCCFVLYKFIFDKFV